MVQENNLKKIIIICGPTASGKTELAIKCALKLNTEIISADSMNVYKGLNIGTAKPSSIEMEKVKHHLIDVVNPNETFSVSDYKRLAEPVIEKLHKEGKIPIICGGTGFYINSILYDLSYGNGSGDLKVREKYKLLAEEKGNEYVYKILQEKDPITAEKLHYNDSKRVIRALEIFENGQKKSEIKDDFTPKYQYDAYQINYPRQSLYERIDKRVDTMFEKGLIQEVKTFVEKGISLRNQCMQGIGYKEIFPYLNGEASLIDTINLIKTNTRHYAKRQITFFKKLDNLHLLNVEDYDIMTERIINNL